MFITPATEALRRDLARTWQLAPYRVEVVLVPTGHLHITVDGTAPTDAQMETFAARVEKVAADRRAQYRQQN